MRPSTLCTVSFIACIPLLAGFASAASLRSRRENPFIQLRSTNNCPKSPGEGKVGDSRCRLISTAGKIDTTTGCPSHGCQKCPDEKIYSRAITNYCLSEPSTTCGRPKYKCAIVCAIDPRCTAMEFDRDEVACGCPCLKCPDGKFYGPTGDYTAAKALSRRERQQSMDNSIAKRRDDCPPCPEYGKAADSRCKITRQFGYFDQGCDTCGCQLCPDNKYYANNVVNYCSSKSSDSCGVTPLCRILFLTDTRCEALEPNPDSTPNLYCEPKCQKCPDGKIYGDGGDYTKLQPLSSSEEEQCLHIKYPFPQAQDLCS